MDQIVIAIIIAVVLVIVVYLIDKIFSNPADRKPTARKTNSQSNENDDDNRGRDPVLHYEVTKGKFGNSSRQSLSYSGKKARWK